MPDDEKEIWLEGDDFFGWQERLGGKIFGRQVIYDWWWDGRFRVFGFPLHKIGATRRERISPYLSDRLKFDPGRDDAIGRLRPNSDGSVAILPVREGMEHYRQVRFYVDPEADSGSVSSDRTIEVEPSVRVSTPSIDHPPQAARPISVAAGSKDDSEPIA